MKRKEIIGLICGTLAAPLAIIAALLSSGGGHGDYYWAGILFPIPLFLLTFELQPVALAYLFIQYSLYGWLTGRWLSQGKKKKAGIWILCLHIIPMLTFIILRASDKI